MMVKCLPRLLIAHLVGVISQDLFLTREVAKTAAKPNILVLFIDDLGLNQIQLPQAPFGYTGIDGLISTPHLANFAKQGMTFMQWYSAFHLCSPSRASMMTGRVPTRVGIDSGVLTSEAIGGIPANETTVAEALSDLGYATAMFGKWHLGQREQFLPHNHGFHQYFGIPYSCDMGESAWGKQNRSDPFQSVPLPLLSATAGHVAEVVEQPVDLSSLTQRYVDFGVDFMSKQVAAKKPFFLYAAFNHVHQPNFANKKFCGSSKREGIGDAVQEMDDAVGQLLAAVNQAGADENTLVFFTSDNGAPPSGDNLGNLPLRGYKASNWEGGIREPAIVRWLGKVPQGVISYELAGTYDIFATAIATAGGKVPSDRAIDGMDLTPVLLHGKTFKDRCLFHWHDHDTLTAVRCGDYKVHYKTAGAQWKGDAKPKNTTIWPSGVQNPPLMFNVRHDLSESVPIPPNSKEYKQVLATVSAAKEAHEKSIVPVCCQMKKPCGGNQYSYAICKDPKSQKKYSQWPVCTSNPKAWTAKTCV